MGTTPTDVVNWADGLALKEDPNTARQEQGWIGTEASSYNLSYVFQDTGVLGNTFRIGMTGSAPSRYLRFIVKDDSQGDQFVLDLKNKLINGGSGANGANAFGYIQVTDTSFVWKFINKGSTPTIESNTTSGYIEVLVRFVTPEGFVEDYDIYRDTALVSADTAWSQFISYDQNDLASFDSNNPNGIVSISSGNVGEKPVLEVQNGLQNNQAQWVNFFNANMQQVDSDEESFHDLWAWDTAPCLGASVDPFVFVISTSGGETGLSWVGFVSAATPTLWDEHKVDSLTGARYLEFMDMMNRGLAIQLYDGNGILWTIYAPNGIGADEAKMSGSARAGGNVDFTITTPTVGLVILANGAVQPDFESLNQFDTLNSTDFATFNPTGIRVGVWGTQRLLARGTFPNASASNRLIKGHNQRKKWIRPLNVSSQAADPDFNTTQFPMDLILGKRYTVKATATYATPQNVVRNFYKRLNGTIAIQVKNNNSNRKTENLFGEFNVTQDQTPAGIWIDYDVPFSNPQGDTTDISDLYGYGNFYDNYIIIEESE